MKKKETPVAVVGLPKAKTGIEGLDQITEGGLPAGRPSLICGAAGCGKTMLAMEFLLRGATQFGEPGVFMAFEESAEELAANVRSLGFDVEKLCARRKIAVDYVRIERSEIEEAGEYDLDGLFIRLEHAIASVGAKRVVLDTLEALFAGLPNEAILRAELRRLFRWLKERGMTAVITAERGENGLTRYGLEEYVADCVILLDHRIDGQISTRRLRVVKYRGSSHGTNEYPFMIGAHGLSVLPVTSLRLDHKAPTQRVATGIARLDDMLGGKGVYRGSSVLVSGAPGTGKSSIGAIFVHTACRRGERCLVFAYEESGAQMLRNMRSIGVDLAPWIDQGLLQIHASRPTLQGLEQHLVQMHDAVLAFRPNVVVVDPISNLGVDENDQAVKPTLMRLIDFLKQRQITAVFTNLSGDTATNLAVTQVGVSSLMDTWLLLSNLESNGERTRTLQVLKSRGMAHSNRVREFLFSDHGVDLVDVFLLGDQVLTGSARIAHQQRVGAIAGRPGRDGGGARPRSSGRRLAIEAQIAALNAELSEMAEGSGATFAGRTPQAQDGLRRGEVSPAPRPTKLATRSRKTKR
jgi:circadian clock protein KaiC